MLLVASLGCAVLNLVRRAMKFSHDPPQTCEGVCELVDLPVRRVRTDRLACKDNVSNGVNFGMGAMQINELLMKGMLLLDQ